MEMIMTDLERANQVGCLLASGITSRSVAVSVILERLLSELEGQLLYFYVQLSLLTLFLML